MSARSNRQQIELMGIGASPGIVVGPVYLVHAEDDRVVERSITESEIPREVVRLEEALTATRHQLRAIQEQIDEAIGHEGASIFDAHLLVVDDRAFIEEVIAGIRERRLNVEAVLWQVAEKYGEALRAVQDKYLGERGADIRDVTRRILRNLAGGADRVGEGMTPGSVVVANDLPPSETAALNRNRVAGFAIDLGSQTSHTAIMARALEIPAVVGLQDISIQVNPGDQILVDGYRGVVIINPTARQIAQYRRREVARREIQTELGRLRQQPPETKDGYVLMLAANIELPSDVDSVNAYGASGVGLFRTEYLYLTEHALPDEDAQVKAYTEVAERIAPKPVVIRTLDLGGDKFSTHFNSSLEANPFLGWRAIRFCLAQPEVFKSQLRALLRASVHENLRIMYPMICNVEEVIRANVLLEGCKGELDRAGIPYNRDLEVGVMIEIPSAALTADLIAPHVSFFSIGTNDLIQYTLAVDRVNERVAHLYEPTHPAILKLIQHTIEVGHQFGHHVSVCGEMAANPMIALLLMGMGVDELSVNPPAVPLVKDAVRSVTFGQAEQLAEAARESASGAAVLEMCRELVRKSAPEILELLE